MLASCSDHSELNPLKSEDASQVSYKTVQERTLPDNSANPFDSAGKIHNQLMEAYYMLPGHTGQNVSLAVDSLARLNTDFILVKTPSFVATDPIRVSAIAGSSFTALETAVSNSQMSIHGKASFIDFAEDLMLLYSIEDDYGTVYSFIASYENGILADTSLTAIDKKTILITASITRYAAYASKKKPKKNTDPEWDLMIGHLVAAVEGTGSGTAEAILLSLSVGITENAD